MNYFVFNNINSKDLGIIVKNRPIIPKAERNVEKIEVNGRNGYLHKDTKTFKSIIYQLECILLEENNLSKINLWLNGEGKISFSNYPGLFWNAWIVNQIDYTSVAYKTSEFPLQLELSPFSYSEKLIEVELTEAKTINIKQSTAEILPLIEVYATGDVVLNINDHYQELFSIDGFVELDSGCEEAFKGLISKNGSVNGEFLKLNPGENQISWIGDVTKIVIKYRETYL